MTLGWYASGERTVGTLEQQLRSALDRIWFVEMNRSGP